MKCQQNLAILKKPFHDFLLHKKHLEGETEIRQKNGRKDFNKA